MRRERGGKRERTAQGLSQSLSSYLHQVVVDTFSLSVCVCVWLVNDPHTTPRVSLPLPYTLLNLPVFLSLSHIHTYHPSLSLSPPLSLSLSLTHTHTFAHTHTPIITWTLSTQRGRRERRREGRVCHLYLANNSCRSLCHQCQAMSSDLHLQGRVQS